MEQVYEWIIRVDFNGSTTSVCQQQKWILNNVWQRKNNKKDEKHEWTEVKDKMWIYE